MLAPSRNVKLLTLVNRAADIFRNLFPFKPVSQAAYKLPSLTAGAFYLSISFYFHM